MTQRPQDLNRDLRKHQARFNTGRTSTAFPSNYAETLEKDIRSMEPIPPKNVVTSELYQQNATFVDCVEEFDKMIADIKQQKVISVDYEFHTDDSYTGFVSIVSICTWTNTYVIDPLYELWERMKILKEILECPKIMKVFCNMDNDVLLGQSTFQAFMRGAIDVNFLYHEYKNQMPEEVFTKMKNCVKIVMEKKAQQAMKKAVITEKEILQKWDTNEKISYEKLVGGFYGILEMKRLNKNLRLSDWRKRPLGDLLHYAARDVFYLLGIFYMIYDKVGMKGLEGAIRKGQSLLLKQATVRTHKKVLKTPGVDTLGPKWEQFERLYLWRDNLAQRLDFNPKCIIPDDKLIKLCKTKITTMDDLLQFLVPFESNDVLMKQKRVVYAYIINDQEFIQKMKGMICHNCNRTGHLGFECVEDPDPQARAAYLRRPENREKKRYQRQRKDKNYIANKMRKAASDSVIHE